jgi:hypothetical protein
MICGTLRKVHTSGNSAEGTGSGKAPVETAACKPARMSAEMPLTRRAARPPPGRRPAEHKESRLEATATYTRHYASWTPGSGDSIHRSAP